MKQVPQKNNKPIKHFVLISSLILFCTAVASLYAYRPDTKTTAPEVADAINRFTIISPEDHPRLYFNQSEIDNIRRVILVEKSNPIAISVFDRIRNTTACDKPASMDSLSWPSSYSTALPCTIRNMKTTFSYLIEPNTAKAQDIRKALLSWTQTYGPYWSVDPQGGGHIHYVLPFMYDAIYNSGVLSATDKSQLDRWFSQAADTLLKTNDYWQGFNKTRVDKENQIRVGYENWRQWEFHAGVLAGLVSHDDKFATRILNSFPDNYFEVSNISRYVPHSRDIKNMINGLVYPTGYNYDGYHRVYGFNAPYESYNGQNSGQGQHYHFFALLPALLGAEAVTQSGYDMWNFGNQALLRTLERARTWAFSAWDGNLNRDRNWAPIYWIAKKRFPNARSVQEITSDTRSLEDLPYIFGELLPLWGAISSSASNIPPASLKPTPTSQSTNTPNPTSPSSSNPPASPSVLLPASPSLTTSSANNVLRNGDFSSGYENWTFFTNGNGYFLVNSKNKYGVVSITNPNTNTQLYQKGFILQPNSRYEIKFRAYSNTGNDLKLYIHKHTHPYPNYGLAGVTVDLTTDWRSYSYSFTTTNLTATQDTRLRFWFPGSARTGDTYYFDDVSLIQN